MNKQQIEQKLERLTELNAQLTLLELDKKRAIPAEVQNVLNDIELEFSPKIQSIKEQVEKLEAEAKVDVIALGETVKGGSFQFTFNNGRVTWDTKSLEGYAAGHPEIVGFRKQGEPYVSVKKI